MINQLSTDLRIIRSTEPVVVEHPIFLIYGQPGLGKSSLSFSAADPILLNFDSESALARTVNRRDAIEVLTVDMYNALIARQDEILGPFKTIVIDTAGCCVNLLGAVLIDENPKLNRGGGELTLQGFGALKSRFRSWIRELRRMGKDIVFVSHNKEEKNGDVTFMRPDITGASKDEVLRLADCVGFLYMNGKNRVLDFNPTESWFGKNPAQWDAFKVPSIAKSTDFLAKLIADAKQSLGKISEASANIALQVDDWRAQIATFNTAEDYNRAIPQIKAMAPALQPQVAKMLMDGAVVCAIPFNKITKLFVSPEPKPEMSESFL